jgi:hypothetical protein
VRPIKANSINLDPDNSVHFDKVGGSVATIAGGEGHAGAMMVEWFAAVESVTGDKVYAY